MTSNIQVTFLLVPSIIVTLMFFIYGYNYYFLIKANRGYRPPKSEILLGKKPTIAIHLPIYKEKYVVRRLLSACSKMAECYGREHVRIVVLDDSDDETTQEAEAVSQMYAKEGFRVEVSHRVDRTGFKAGALQAALERTKEEYIAVFDSDFIPPENFLNETVPYLLSDERLGGVQCRWSYLNRDYNFITKAIAIGMGAHFLVEQPGRYAAGCFLNFNGSGFLARTQALRESGGWQPNTLAEDLDASYRIQLRGYHILYLRDVPVPGEITPTITSFKRQQSRWARGSLQTAKKILPQLLKKGELTLTQKVEAGIHLTYYLVHPLIFISFLLALLAGIFSINTIGFVIEYHPELGQNISEAFWGAAQVLGSIAFGQPLFILLAAMLGLCFAGVWVVYAITLRIEGLSLVRNIPSLLILGLIGFGISISNTIQAMEALFSRNVGSFERTPKYALENRFGEWRKKKYQVPLNRTLYLELTATIVGAVTVVKALYDMNVGLIAILSFYVVAYGFVAILSIFHSGEDR